MPAIEPALKSTNKQTATSRPRQKRPQPLRGAYARVIGDRTQARR